MSACFLKEKFMIRAIYIDIDNTLLDFDAYVKESLRSGLEQFGLRPYEDWMYDTFEKVNSGLWLQIEDGSLTFEELQKIRFNRVFEAIGGIDFDGVVFEKYFREFLNESAIPVEGAMEMLEYLAGKYILCTASNGPYNQQIHRLEIAGMLKYFRHHFISEKIGFSKPAKEFFDIAVNIAHYHHEKWNGKGYPSKLAGKAIPIEARIMALVDVFDALVSKRCYKAKMNFDDAFKIIEEALGSHFDPDLGSIFLKCREQLEDFYIRMEEEEENN